MNVLTKEQMEEIYRRNCDMIYRVCLLQLKHEQDALDAVSETFVRLFQKKWVGKKQSRNQSVKRKGGKGERKVM